MYHARYLRDYQRIMGAMIMKKTGKGPGEKTKLTTGIGFVK